ncbi:hypothetical protein TGVAND_358940 [Toxoplasma gondii VAND]|uniref:Uncharacterized protein n=3 Tax=Toxoplasma gondii TaxID=5811 RepID=V4Z7Y2_TOXGV|nr:hypothetical protein TGVEG_358940 [Toxoplasma gondii VEG]KFG36252.1 hypothetical protein TGP89_358940 [Toxoplasma gondii p89]KFH03601.1 hypothetical protein TGVAND_358940 [Toxoplasma gondii VAND]
MVFEQLEFFYRILVAQAAPTGGIVPCSCQVLKHLYPYFRTSCVLAHKCVGVFVRQRGRIAESRALRTLMRCAQDNGATIFCSDHVFHLPVFYFPMETGLHTVAGHLASNVFCNHKAFFVLVRRVTDNLGDT